MKPNIHHKHESHDPSSLCCHSSLSSRMLCPVNLYLSIVYDSHNISRSLGVKRKEGRACQEDLTSSQRLIREPSIMLESQSPSSRPATLHILQLSLLLREGSDAPRRLHVLLVRKVRQGRDQTQGKRISPCAPSRSLNNIPLTIFLAARSAQGQIH